MHVPKLLAFVTGSSVDSQFNCLVFIVCCCMSFVCWCVFVFGLVNGQLDFVWVNIRWVNTMTHNVAVTWALAGVTPQAVDTLAHQIGDVAQEYDEMELVMHIGQSLVYLLCVRPSSTKWHNKRIRTCDMQSRTSTLC